MADGQRERRWVDGELEFVTKIQAIAKKLLNGEGEENAKSYIETFCN